MTTDFLKRLYWACSNETCVDAADLEDCPLKIQEDSGDPIVVQIGDGGKMLHVSPC